MHDERGEPRSTEGEGCQGHRVEPAALRSFDEAEHQARQRHHRKHGAERIERQCPVAILRDQDEHGNDERDGDHPEEQLNAPPPERLEEGTGDDRPDDGAGRTDARPHSDRERPALLRIRIYEGRQSDREHGRGSDAGRSS